MKKRVVILIAIGLVIILGTYIYLGMYWAETSKIESAVETINPEEIDVRARLQEAGAMSEESRLEMIERLQNAKY